MSEPVDPRIAQLLQPTPAERAPVLEDRELSAMRVRLQPTTMERRSLRPRRLPRRRWPVMAVAAVALLALGLAWSQRPIDLPSVGEIAVLSTVDGQVLTPAAVATGAGTLVVEARSERGARVRLDEGRAVFEVDPRGEGRALVVVAGEVEVSVTGTRFSVARDGEQVHVRVERGAVAVQWPGGARNLRAGERWSGPVPAVSVVEAVPAPEVASREPAAVEAVPLKPVPPKTVPPKTGSAKTGSAEPRPDPTTARSAARAWARVLDGVDSGVAPERTVSAVDAFLAAHATSPLHFEARWLRARTRVEAMGDCTGAAEDIAVLRSAGGRWKAQVDSLKMACDRPL